MIKFIKGFKTIFSSLMFFLLIGIPSEIFGQVISFNSDQWQITNGKMVDHLGRKALKGTAILKNVGEIKTI